MSRLERPRQKRRAKEEDVRMNVPMSTTRAQRELSGFAQHSERRALDVETKCEGRKKMRGLREQVRRCAPPARISGQSNETLSRCSSSSSRTSGGSSARNSENRVRATEANARAS